MSADFNTEILMKGTKKELLAMTKVLKSYVTEKQEQYNKNRDCAYMISIRINGENYLDKLTDEQLKEVVENANGSVKADAMGPYGVFGLLEEVTLFEEMAEAAPMAYFDGLMSGFNVGGDQAKKGVLENKLLYLYIDYPDDDFDDEDDFDDKYGEEAQAEYIKAMKKLLPYSKFVKLFKVDKEEFAEEDYDDFIYDQMIDGGFPDIDYDDFMDALENCAKIDEDAFYEITADLSGAGVVSFDDYCGYDEEWDEEDEEWDQERSYDPIAKKWKE